MDLNFQIASLCIGGKLSLMTKSLRDSFCRIVVHHTDDATWRASALEYTILYHQTTRYAIHERQDLHGDTIQNQADFLR